ncbi:MAG: ATP-binding cassette domain-containing protein [Flavonifractor plautii]
MPGKPGPAGSRSRLGVTLESILQDITFSSTAGIMALIGPNGAGKSSLFRSILGQIPTRFDPVSAGRGYPSQKISYVPEPRFDRGIPSVSWISSPPPSAAGRFPACPRPSGTRQPSAWPGSTVRR